MMVVVGSFCKKRVGLTRIGFVGGFEMSEKGGGIMDGRRGEGDGRRIKRIGG